MAEGLSAEIPKPEHPLKLSVTLENISAPKGRDVAVNLQLSTESDQAYEFSLGSIPQDFGIYILGPWGTIQPDPTKVRPENWMHGEHGPSERIVVSKVHPYHAKVLLSAYFSMADAHTFKPGIYQINVKFYDANCKLRVPLDSGPVSFVLSGE
jgi:hypothetical protein